MARAYTSPHREQQANGTRVRILEALGELMLERDPATISVGDVARQAGVAERTVYRHYPTREALFGGLQEHVTEQIRIRRGTDQLRSVEDLAAAAAHAFGVIDELGPAYRAAQVTAAGRRAHQESNRVGRRAEISGALAAVSEHLEEPVATRLHAAVHTLASSNALFLMQDVWGLTTDEAAETVAWAIRALVDAAQHTTTTGPTSRTTREDGR